MSQTLHRLLAFSACLVAACSPIDDSILTDDDAAREGKIFIHASLDATSELHLFSDVYFMAPKVEGVRSFEYCLNTRTGCNAEDAIWYKTEAKDLGEGKTAYKGLQNFQIKEGQGTFTVRVASSDPNYLFGEFKLSLESSGGGSPSQPAPLTDADCYKAEDFICQTEKLIVEYTNEYRRRVNGLQDLQFHGRLSWASRNWSVTMSQRGGISHGGFPGQRIADYRREFGSLDINIIGENVAMFGGRNQSSPEAVARQLVTQWYNSPPHRGAMLSRNYTILGAGVAVSQRGVYGTQLFGNIPRTR